MSAITVKDGRRVHVDDDVAEAISKLLALGGSVSLERGYPTIRIDIHRLALGVRSSSTLQIDHKNGDKLDARRMNLRLATPSQNQANRAKSGGTSRHKGVRRTRSGRWSAQITVQYKSRHLGVFSSEEDAARAYDTAAQEEFGEFPRLNFPEVPRTS